VRGNMGNNTCVACGGAGQPCCAGSSCNAGCCVPALQGGGDTCVAVGMPCFGMGNRMCMGNGACGDCGAIGEGCCFGGACTAGQSACRMGACVGCGGKGQPCCANDFCANGACMNNMCP
jgi:hypothetical protein